MANTPNYGGPLHAAQGINIATPLGIPGVGSVPSAGYGDGGTMAQERKPEITHIEIRRVQNGFVIQGINIRLFEAHRGGFGEPQRWSFIAKDAKELADVLTMLIDGKDIEWLPSYDLPIVDLTRRVPPPHQP